jgi:hypothetical protein
MKTLQEKLDAVALELEPILCGNALFWFSFICLFYGAYLFVKE